MKSNSIWVCPILFLRMHITFITMTNVHVWSVCLSNIKCKPHVNSSIYVQIFWRDRWKGLVPKLLSNCLITIVEHLPNIVKVEHSAQNSKTLLETIIKEWHIRMFLPGCVDMDNVWNFITAIACTKWASTACFALCSFCVLLHWMLWKRRTMRTGDNNNCLKDGESSAVIRLVVELRGLGMTILSSVTADLYLTIGLSAVFRVKMVDDVIDPPARQLPDVSWDYIAIGLILQAINTIGSAYTDSAALAEIRWNTHSRFRTAKHAGTCHFFKHLWVLSTTVSSEMNFDHRQIIRTSFVALRNPNYQSMTVVFNIWLGLKSSYICITLK